MTTLLAFLLTIAILVVVHEYGHYLAAKLSGVKVLKFSVGFGRTLYSRRWGRDGTEWAICALPLGGYVKMLDEREGDVDAAERHRAFNRASVWRRMAIVVAGPLANFILAIVVFWALLVHGLPALKPIIGEPDAATPAAIAGLRNGDEIVAVNERPTPNFSALQLALAEAAAKQQAAILELANGQQKEIDFAGHSLGKENGRPEFGINPYMPDLAPVIGRVEVGSVAEHAGLKVGDKVLSVNDQPVAVWQDFAKVARASPGKTLRLEILSGGKQRHLQLAPAILSEGGVRIGRVGVAPQINEALFKDLQIEERHSLLAALPAALTKTWDSAVFSLEMMGRMVLGQVSWRNLSGPVSIADYAGKSAQNGWISFAGFLALISIGLGVINLLPIPLLDGGHLMYYIVEVFRGQPLSERAMELGARIGMVCIGLMIVLALYNDMLRLLNG